MQCFWKPVYKYIMYDCGLIGFSGLIWTMKAQHKNQVKVIITCWGFCLFTCWFHNSWRWINCSLRVLYFKTSTTIITKARFKLHKHVVTMRHLRFLSRFRTETPQRRRAF